MRQAMRPAALASTPSSVARGHRSCPRSPCESVGSARAWASPLWPARFLMLGTIFTIQSVPAIAMSEHELTFECDCGRLASVADALRAEVEAADKYLGGWDRWRQMKVLADLGQLRQGLLRAQWNLDLGDAQHLLAVAASMGFIQRAPEDRYSTAPPMCEPCRATLERLVERRPRRS